MALAVGVATCDGDNETVRPDETVSDGVALSEADLDPEALLEGAPEGVPVAELESVAS